MLFDLNVTRDIRPLLTGRHAIKRLKDFVDKNIWVVPSRFPFITYFYFIKTLLHLFSFSTTLTQQSRKRVQNTWELQSCDTKTARENCQHNIYTFSLNIVKYKIVLMWTFKYSTHCFRHASLHYNAYPFLTETEHSAADHVGQNSILSIRIWVITVNLMLPKPKWRG